MRPADRYALRVAGARPRTSFEAPTLLDISAHGDGLPSVFTRLGFLVTRMTLGDGSLQSLTDRLAATDATFDVVCCRGVLSLVDDWPELVDRIGGRLRPRGVFFYSVNRPGTVAERARHWFARATRRPMPGPPIHRPVPIGELVPALRRAGLAPRQLVTGDEADAHGTAYMGYSLRWDDRIASLDGLRREFAGAGECRLAPACDPGSQ
jgi:SAM-dependent methyltransferase